MRPDLSGNPIVFCQLSSRTSRPEVICARCVVTGETTWVYRKHERWTTAVTMDTGLPPPPPQPPNGMRARLVYTGLITLTGKSVVANRSDDDHKLFARLHAFLLRGSPSVSDVSIKKPLRKSLSEHSTTGFDYTSTRSITASSKSPSGIAGAGLSNENNVGDVVRVNINISFQSL